jgi:hypothetical protein
MRKHTSTSVVATIYTQASKKNILDKSFLFVSAQIITNLGDTSKFYAPGA